MPTTSAVASLREAILLLSQYGENCKIIAGGTDVLAKMKKGAVLPEVLINIKGIQELNYIAYDVTGGLRIGALTSIGSVADSPLINRQFSVLAQAASLLGTPVISRQATIGGNLCNAAPSAETAPALMVLGARLKIAGVEGEKIIPIEGFFTGPGQTCLKHHQILTEVQISDMPLHSGAVYLKQSRIKGADLAIAGVAALVIMQGDILKDVKIALGAVAPTPIRAYQAETILEGKKWNEELLERAGQAAAQESRPVDDVRGSADYRRKLVAILVKRAVRQAIE